MTDIEYYVTHLAVSVMGSFAMIESDQSTWIMACAGSFGAVFRGASTRVWRQAVQWVIGIFFGIAFEKGIDHLAWHGAEAFFSSLVSVEATKLVASRIADTIYPSRKII